MVLLPPREFQSPYQGPTPGEERPFVRKINSLVTKNIQESPIPGPSA
jgi:hypothetical protein